MSSGGSNWIVNTEPASKRRYYFNTATGQTSWDEPPEGADNGRAASRASRQPPLPLHRRAPATTLRQALPSRRAVSRARDEGHEVHVDPSTGWKYFYDEVRRSGGSGATGLVDVPLPSTLRTPYHRWQPLLQAAAVPTPRVPALRTGTNRPTGPAQEAGENVWLPKELDSKRPADRGAGGGGNAAGMRRTVYHVRM